MPYHKRIALDEISRINGNAYQMLVSIRDAKCDNLVVREVAQIDTLVNSALRAMDRLGRFLSELDSAIEEIS